MIKIRGHDYGDSWGERAAPCLLDAFRRSILEETDGPMLIHGLQGLHERPIYLPREQSLQPDRDRLEERYAAFQSSG